MTDTVPSAAPPHSKFPRHRLHMISRGPGGPFEPADYDWARGCRKAGWSLRVIASYFEPQPSADELRRVLKEKRRSRD